jgi:quercetin dioxygenase-like cupin family protein
MQNESNQQDIIAMVFKSENVEITVLNEKTTRKLLSYGGELMMAEVTFKKGGVGEPHKHDEHEQISYIVNGSFEVTVNGKKSVVKKGDGFYAAKKVEHGVVALEDNSVILDIFTPIRKDFLS